MRFFRGISIVQRRMHGQYLIVIVTCGILLCFFSYFKSEIHRLENRALGKCQCYYLIIVFGGLYYWVWLVRGARLLGIVLLRYDWVVGLNYHVRLFRL